MRRLHCKPHTLLRVCLPKKKKIGKVILELNQCSFLHFKMAQIQPEIRKKEITALHTLINHNSNKSIILGEIL